MKSAFIDLKAEDFPFTMRFYAEGTDDLLKEIVVDGPGAVEIPSAASLGTNRVRVEVTYATGLTMKSGD